MSRFLILVCCLVLSLFAAGCGGAGDKGKNKDKDVPKSIEALPGK
jgi:hypothetical protein